MQLRPRRGAVRIINGFWPAKRERERARESERESESERIEGGGREGKSERGKERGGKLRNLVNTCLGCISGDTCSY